MIVNNKEKRPDASKFESVAPSQKQNSLYKISIFIITHFSKKGK